MADGHIALGSMETREMTEVREKVITQQLGPVSEDDIVVLKYSPEILDELEGLSKGKHRFEAVVVDSTNYGFLFPAEILIEASRLVESLVELRGAILFLKTDCAAAIIRESLTGVPTFRVFGSYSEIFDYSPALTKYVKSALGTSAGFEEEGTDLSRQILLSSIPILTSQGLDLKTSFEKPGKLNRVLVLIDNYSPIASIIARSHEKFTEEELLEVIRELEKAKLIHPIFKRVPFLANCFKNQSSFSLDEYFKGCQILTQPQIDELMLELQGTPLKERMNVGTLAVKKGMLSSRVLEVALQEQAFYGQSNTDDTTKVKGASSATAEESRVQSLVGHLGSTDPMSLLQNMATNRETGLLSVENRDMQFKAHFENGKPVHARIGKIHGDSAVVEFASAWKHGIFVFIKRNPSIDLTKDTCKLTKPLDKLLLDAALAQDNMEIVWKKLPNGIDSSLEKNEDKKAKLEGDPLIEPREKQKLTVAQMELVKRVWEACDGLSSISRLIKNLGEITTSDACFAIDVLLEYEMVTVPDSDLSKPLEKFQSLVMAIREHLGNERNSAFLRLSFRDTLLNSGRARVFILSPKCEVGVDMSAARRASTSLSLVLGDLENWQVKYIEYVSQEIEKSVLLSIIREVHEKN